MGKPRLLSKIPRGRRNVIGSLRLGYGEVEEVILRLFCIFFSIDKKRNLL